MALNKFEVKPAHDKASVELHGDMSVSFDDAVSSNFSIRLFTVTNEWFTFDSTKYKFINQDGVRVSGLIFGGRANLFIDMMFDPDKGEWVITGTNMVAGDAMTGGDGGSGGGGGGDTTEYALTFQALPTLTPINVNNGFHYRGKLYGNAKLANPVNMKPGDRLIIVIEQDMVGGRTLDYDGAYGFKDAVYPKLTVESQATDTLVCYMTGDYTLQCDLYPNYSVIRPIAYGVNFGYTLQATVYESELTNVDNLTVQVIRSGQHAEAWSTVGWYNKLNTRIRGNFNAIKNEYPLLRLEKTDRAAFGKAVINIEGGKMTVIENLRISGGVSQDSGNGTGVLINPAADAVRIKNCIIYDNENGVRSATSKHPVIDIEDCYIHSNGWSTRAGYNGQTHNAYMGENDIVRVRNTTFYNSLTGHNYKSRAGMNLLRNVYTRKSAQSRELDFPDTGIVHAYDCVFLKPADATQNNMIGIGQEMAQGNSKPQEYFFFNCYFHHDMHPGRGLTFIDNKQGTALNTVAVHFIDCEFGGIGLERGPSLFEGPYTITLTGGPTGPRGSVGDVRMKWDGTKAANTSTNPFSIPETPLANLPAMTPIPEMPDYPAFFLEPPPVPPLPSNSAGGGTKPPDTQAPNIDLTANQIEFLTAGILALTATVTDNEGIGKVEFFRDDVLISTDSAGPFVASEEFDWQDNGTYVYSAVAHDTNKNTKTSQSITVTVNIPSPHLKPATRFNAELQAKYDSAILNAPANGARAAAGQAIVDALSPTATAYPKLIIYRNGAPIIEHNYGSKALVIDDGYDVAVTTPLSMASVVINGAASFATGEWWFEYIGGGLNNQTVIAGTVGGPGSNAEIVFDEDIDPSRYYDIDLQIVMPRLLDNLA